MSRDKKRNRTQEVDGSSPFSSTTSNDFRNNNLAKPGRPWWPPFCFVVDVVAAALTAAVLWTGFDLRGLVTGGNPASAEERAKMMLPGFAPEVEVKQCAIDFSAPGS
jgi:hypothetical protein